MADKETESRPFIDISETSFLKRYFVKNEELDVMMAPLSEVSIARMLHWMVSSPIGVEAQHAMMLQDVVEQYFLYGREVYDERREYFMNISQKIGVYDKIKWLSFDEIWERYENRTFCLSSASCAVDADFPSAIREMGSQISDRVTQVGSYTPRLHCSDYVVQTSQLANVRLQDISHGLEPAHGVVNWFTEQNMNNISTSEAPMGHETQEVLTFDDTTGVEVVNVGASAPPPSVPNTATKSELGRFLERPIKFLSGTWTTGDGNLASINPWQAFLTNPGVQNKLQNFQYIRGTLHSRLVVNASPFHYGVLGLTYWPYKDDTSVELSLDINKAYQLPHVFLNPSDGQSVELTMPFVNMKDRINLSPVGYVNEYARYTGLNMGRLDLTEFVPLARANAAGAAAVEYSLYLWMTDVDLSMPTAYPLITQSGGEYAMEGVISRPMSILSDIASRLADVPVLGRFARATEIGSTAVGKIASIFGFARPIMLEDVHHYKPRLFGPLAGVTGRDNAYKLTVDPKNETSIDPGILGLEGTDSMALANITTRPGVVGFLDWNGEDTSGHALADLPVSPGVVDSTDGVTDTQYRRYRMTPVCFATAPFKYWTGSLTYRIQIIATQYHRGRIRLTYFPAADAILPVNDYSNLAWNKIIDLQEDTDVEFTVPWAQNHPWQEFSFIEGSFDDPASSFLTSTGNSNGHLLVDVVNQLRAPLDSTSVKIIISVKAGSDYRVAVPDAEAYSPLVFDHEDVRTAWPSDQFNYTVNSGGTRDGPEPTVQSGTLDVSFAGQESTMMFDSLGDGAASSANCIGEEIASLRSLFKRSCLVYRCDWGALKATLQRDKILLATYLSSFTFDQASCNYRSTSSMFASKLDVFPQHPIHYFAPAFLAMRGGVRYRYLSDSERGNQDAGAVDDGNIWVSLIRQDTYMTRVFTGESGGTWGSLRDSVPSSMAGSWGGQEVFKRSMQPGVEFEVPYYFPLNFRVPSAFIHDQGQLAGGNTATGHAAGTCANIQDDRRMFSDEADGVVNVFCSAAEDFTLDWFICVPTMYKLIERKRTFVEA